MTKTERCGEMEVKTTEPDMLIVRKTGIWKSDEVRILTEHLVAQFEESGKHVPVIVFSDNIVNFELLGGSLKIINPSDEEVSAHIAVEVPS